MIYYQMPIGAEKRDSGANFGMRLDRVTTEPDSTVEFRRLLPQPGFLELKMSSRGIDSLSIAGVQYVRAVQLSRAGEGQGEESDQGKEEEKKTIGKFLDEVPVGYIIGIGIGVVIFSGVAD